MFRFPLTSWQRLAIIAASLTVFVATANPAGAQEVSGTTSPQAPAAIAQTTPAPQPVEPQGSASGGELPARQTGRREGKFYHLVLEPTLVQSENVGGDTVICTSQFSHVGCAAPKTAPLPGDLLRIAGNARYNFNKHFGLHYQRVAHLGIAGRTNGKYGNSGYDYEELEGIEWTFNPNFNLNAGWDYRATVCCPGAGDPTNPTPRQKQGPFVAIGTRFGPTSRVGKLFAFNLRTVFVNHRFEPSAQSTLLRGQTDAGRKNEYVPTLYATFPIYGQTRLVPTAGIEYYSTYFDNRPSLSLTFRKVYGFAYRVTPDFSLRAIVKNDQNYAAGPDASHKAYLQLEATLRIQR